MSLTRRKFLRSAASGLFLPVALRAQVPVVPLQIFSPRPSFSAKTLDWANRVVANGDPRPSNTILAAVDAWYNSLVAGGVDSLMISASFVAPGGTVITMLTPFYKVAGSDPYTLNGGTSNIADGVNGIKSIANPVGVFTGVDPNAVFTNSDMGLSIMTATSGAVPTFAYGGGNGGCAMIYCDGGGDNLVASYSAWSFSFTMPIAASAYGFFCANRTASGSATAYCANGANAWALQGSCSCSGTVPAAGGNIGVNGTGVCATIGGGTKWYSFLGVHHALSSAQGQTLFNATMTLRQSFGGGYT